MGTEMPVKLALCMPWGLEISGGALREIARQFEESGKKLFSSLPLKDLRLDVKLGDEGTKVPLSETGPFLDALGLPINILDRQALLTLFDDRNQPHQITCRITHLAVFRGVQIQLSTDHTGYFTTAYHKVYSFKHLYHVVPTELGGPSFYQPDSWRAEMLNVSTEGETTWKAKITFP